MLEGFFSPHDYQGYLNTFIYQNEKVVLDKYTIIGISGEQIFYNWFQYFNPESIAAEFGSCGLRIEAYYADVCGSAYNDLSDEFAIVAGKM